MHIFMGCLSVDLKELALRKHFEPCGTVEAVRLVRDAKSGLGKGFGYVLFEVHSSIHHYYLTHAVFGLSEKCLFQSFSVYVISPDHVHFEVILTSGGH